MRYIITHDFAFSNIIPILWVWFESKLCPKFREEENESVCHTPRSFQLNRHTLHRVYFSSSLDKHVTLACVYAYATYINTQTRVPIRGGSSMKYVRVNSYTMNMHGVSTCLSRTYICKHFNQPTTIYGRAMSASYNVCQFAPLRVLPSIEI